MSIHSPFEDRQEEEIDLDLSEPIPRHTYPRWLNIGMVLTMVSCTAVVAHFLLYEMPRHRQIHADLVRAENLFAEGRYQEAQHFYTSVLEKELKCKKAYLRLSQICFTQSAQDDDMYGAALLHLLLSGCTNEQFAEVCSFVPPARKEIFMALFTTDQPKTEQSTYDLPDSWRIYSAFDPAGGYTA